MKTRHLLLGALFGFVLVRAGATDEMAIREMFLLTDLHLVGVIGTAVAALALLFLWVRRRGVRTLGGAPVVLERKAMVPGLVGGALAFGAGWAVSGTCPGTAIAQIGEGRLHGVFTLGGILAGVMLADLRSRRRAPECVAPDHGGASSATTSPG